MHTYSTIQMTTTTTKMKMMMMTQTYNKAGELINKGVQQEFHKSKIRTNFVKFDMYYTLTQIQVPISTN